LLRDVAYSQIPRGTRSHLHRRAAEWIETLSERVEDRAEMLAYHWGEAASYARQASLNTAGLDERAREALTDAAERAESLSAFQAAARFHGRAAELWPEESTERTLAAARRLIALWAARVPLTEGAELVEPLVAAGHVEEASLSCTQVSGWVRGTNRAGTTRTSMPNRQQP
jgi:predicted ATPase